MLTLSTFTHHFTTESNPNITHLFGRMRRQRRGLLCVWLLRTFKGSSSEDSGMGSGTSVDAATLVPQRKADFSRAVQTCVQRKPTSLRTACPCVRDGRCPSS